MPSKRLVRIRRAIFAGIAVAIIFGLSGCNDSKTEAPGPQSTATNSAKPVADEVPEAPKPVNYDGVWKSSDDKPRMSATIENGVITVKYISENTEMTYWRGNFFPAADANGVISLKDENYNKAILVPAKSKAFDLSKDSISFEFKALGVTKKVTLVRG